jgi:phosphoadenosine phosphosulfate reductase
MTDQATAARLAELPPLAMDAPLDAKLARTQQVLAACLGAPCFSARQTAVAYTGGKDSGVVLHQWRTVLAEQGLGPLRAISVDTGLKFPQVTAFRDKLADDWGVELTLARPAVDLASYPVAQDKLACCRDLKIIPLHSALAGTGTNLLFSGIRRDEHPSRAGRPYLEARAATDIAPAHWQANPILDWTEMDIWAFITGLGLPYCELYHEGYRSLGCMPCTKPCEGCVLGDDAERAGRDQDKERQLEALTSLGYF